MLFASAQVKLLDSPFLQAQRWNAGYIRRLDADRLLHNFRVNAGLPSSARPLGGWEAPDCELRGHFVGHYLSGLAILLAATQDPDYRNRGDRVVAGLAQCQQKLGDDGYLSAFPRSWFDRLAAGTKVWAPFYTIHKIFAGLLDMHELAGNAQALEVAKGVAGWADAWTAARDEAAMQKVLEVEFGGMNDALYRLTAVTGDRHWMTVGDRFTKKRVFEPLAAQKDMLHGLHMNTHVPQVIGAARRYEMTGDHRFGDVSKFFWQTVTQTRTYATGGSSNNEHWLTEPHELGVEWANGHDHEECCCSYNMLKLGSMLFTHEPTAGMADYYERALLNHRLGAIHPESGHSTYFLSLAPGAWKTRGTEDTTFWCCNGTALEDFSSFNRMIYSHDGGGLWVNLFIPSVVEWKERGVRLRQRTEFPAESRTTLMVEASGREAWTLRLRIPGWARSEEVRVRVNGQPLDALAEPGSYLEVRRIWRGGDRIELEMPMESRWEVFPDRPDVAALVHGPVVLAQQLPLGDLSNDLMHEEGPEVDKVEALAVPALPRDLPRRLKPVTGEPLHFIAEVDGRTIKFHPINDSWERYIVYSPIA
ncbi:MAG TPA: glycoside hydrolase family 127 protein [Sphingomicrobium sp.]|nr:glycoside hydrolase family 127 protein [Sphingomicrobium sp.]